MKDKVTVNTTLVLGGTEMPVRLEMTRAGVEEALAELNAPCGPDFKTGDLVWNSLLGLGFVLSAVKTYKAHERLVAFVSETAILSVSELRLANVRDLLDAHSAQKRRLANEPA